MDVLTLNLQLNSILYYNIILFVQIKYSIIIYKANRLIALI